MDPSRQSRPLRTMNDEPSPPGTGDQSQRAGTGVAVGEVVEDPDVGAPRAAAPASLAGAAIADWGVVSATVAPGWRTPVMVVAMWSGVHGVAVLCASAAYARP